ncbi:MAG: GmrSD restriction endonuclease domain-containing protein [Candidatus Nanopelagicales bacterium]
MTTPFIPDPLFEANVKPVGSLLQRIYYRELALPDFQRNFVWDTKAVIELLRSIMSRFPAGTLLFWKQGSETKGFAARAVAGAPELDGKAADELVLDGQQRLTAVYRALTGCSDERFYVKLEDFTQDGACKKVHQVDFEKSIVAYDLSTKRKFDPEQPDYQFSNGLFPLARISEFDPWLYEYARRKAIDSDPEAEILKRMWAVRDTFLTPLQSYGFPVVTLPSNTPLEAVCNIFETLNRTGKPLGAFELVTARLFPQDIRLRDLWDEARENYSILDEFDVNPYQVLQAVSLRARGSAQRSDVLEWTNAGDITQHWNDVVSGFAGVLNFLRNSHGVATKRWLPYGMILVPMAAAWPELKVLKPLERADAEKRLSQFFWCSTFMANYDQGANSQAGADYAHLKKYCIKDDDQVGWLFEPSEEPPEAVQKFSLAESALLEATVRRKALLAGVMALTIKAGAKDFYSSETMNAARIRERRIDSHHIFPKGFLQDLKKSELMLNRALIDSETNKLIGKKAPSEYLETMATVHDPEKIEDVLESHAIDPRPGSALRADDYGAFILERLQAVVELIEGVTQQKVSRDVTFQDEGAGQHAQALAD